MSSGVVRRRVTPRALARVRAAQGAVAGSRAARLRAAHRRVTHRWVTRGPLRGFQSAPPGLAAPGGTPVGATAVCLIAALAAPSPRRSRLVRVKRGVLIGPVRVGHVKVRIGLGTATVAGTPGRPAILPEGLGDSIRPRK